jgi:septation ring formation regulator EzrA
MVMVEQSYQHESAAVTPEAIHHRLGRIEDEIKTIAEALQHLTRVDERLRQHRDNIDDHEDRLRSLEQVQQKSSGVVTAWERVGWIVLTVGVGALNYFA